MTITPGPCPGSTWRRGGRPDDPGRSTPSGIAVGAGAVWVANNFGGTVSRIDPKTDTVVDTIHVGNGPSGVAVGYGSVWVTNSSDGTLSRIDAVSDAVVKPIPLDGGATDVAVGLGAVWVTDAMNGRVLRVDPQTNQVVAPINVGTGPSAISVGYGSVWVANSRDGTISRIDPQTNQVVGGDPGRQLGPSAIAIGAGGVWVADEFGGQRDANRPGDEHGRAHHHGGQPAAGSGGRGRPCLGGRAGVRRKPPRRHADRAPARPVWLEAIRSRHRHPPRI